MTTTFMCGTGGSTVVNFVIRRGKVYAGAIYGGSTFYLCCPQIEAGDFATSYISSGATATIRTQETATISSVNMDWAISTQGSWLAEFISLDPTPSNIRVVGQPGTSGATPLFINTASQLGQYDRSVTMVTANTHITRAGAITRGASTYTSATNIGRVCLNGGDIVSATLPTGFSALNTTGLRFMTPMAASGGDNMSGYLRSFSYWQSILSDADMQSLTAEPSSLSLSFMRPGALDPRVVFTRASTATRVNNLGVIQVVAANAPRWDYDPNTHVLAGLLLEDTRTNLQLKSTNWLPATTVSGTVDGVRQNDALAPDGTTTAMKLIPSGTSTTHQWSAIFSGAITTTYTHTCYVKAAGYNYVYLELANTAFGANSRYGIFDLSKGTIIAQTGAATIQTVGSGWFRIGITATSLDTTGSYLSNIRLYNTAANALAFALYAGDLNSGVWCWGNQVEVGSFATSYIPTSGTAVIRAADQCYIPTPTGSWFTPNNFTLMAEFDSVTTAVAAGVSNSTDFSNATYLYGGGFNRANTGTVNGLSALSSGVNRQCAAYSTTLLRLSNNGSNVSKLAINAQATTLATTRLGIGMSPWNLDSSLNGHMRRLTYWPYGLTDADMQTTTATIRIGLPGAANVEISGVTATGQVGGASAIKS